MCDANEPLLFQDQFLSGDSRTNENPGLQAMHTMWFREHNRLADLVATADPSLDDEAVFQGRQAQEFRFHSLGISSPIPNQIQVLNMDLKEKAQTRQFSCYQFARKYENSTVIHCYRRQEGWSPRNFRTLSTGWYQN